MTASTRLVFLDLETTGLDSDRCEIWEIGLIVRDDANDDTRYCWQLRPSLRTAEPTGLRIGRYYERSQVTHHAVGTALMVEHPDLANGEVPWHNQVAVAGQVARLLDGATIVGAVPDFDARFLSRFLRRYHQAPTWHYHLVDVETFAAGALRLAPPWGFDDILAEFGLVYDEADRHTALGDAVMVRDLYDRACGLPLDPAPGRAVPA